ncbi:GSCFA domain-containing protein [Massilia rubra]|uniref:GSCFA domain-containing protein n=1 Tax=Massilia rubra TaxID=2607910 RepID=A0ABX0LSU9_9BURK|nr:GSCFA domain-containing protein [Massilia rubra]NHZ34519.1 GSCFA domain-containing protein [Massilia rubra]
MPQHPYQDIPATSHWRKAFDGMAPNQIELVGDFKFKLSRHDKVATAGSCFAQHIARHLGRDGFNFFVTEPGHAIGSPDIKKAHHYGIFSARYGNVYTARQLLQLFDRAYGSFSPTEDCWLNASGRPIDPYRPSIEPGGFSSKEELLRDRVQHLRAVRTMFEHLDVFIFTLGLTEHWRSAIDGSVFPVCPGVAGGEFSPDKHVFHNSSVNEVIAELREFQDKLGQVNPGAKIIFTVSPVPLMATMEPRHVLVSTVASKSILRVAADQLEREFSHIAYFPSYEIVTSPFSKGSYFGPDLRSVTEAGVEHVMRTFLAHATEGGTGGHAPPAAPGSGREQATFDAQAHAIVNVMCDEDLL